MQPDDEVIACKVSTVNISYTFCIFQDSPPLLMSGASMMVATVTLSFPAMYSLGQIVIISMLVGTTKIKTDI